MAQYIIAPAAIQDLDGITSYFATRNVEAGERLLDKFQKKCRYLAQFPQIGRSYAAIRPYLRGIPMDSYIIFYRIEVEQIEILRVVRGNRDLDSLFSE
ncbi:MAG: type II toxin-antitoxin system RelE/ParE family toxin [Cyanothece sp. SIO2G6]|nr:type II toxin-antitoxin system RelE/ParE family toxin [Cyanothece sp. SIO2G6]